MNAPITRRSYLKYGVATVALSSVALTRDNRVIAQQDVSDQELITRTEKPYNAEPPLGKLVERWLTPTPLFFVRNHGTAPKFDLKGYTISVDGMVDRPQSFAVTELTEKFGMFSVTATLTCSGNRRTEFNRVKKVPGVQWDAGAIGNAEWRGVRLSHLLKTVGVQSGAKHVWFEGRDEVTDKGETFPFGGSIPLEKALADTDAVPGCLLAMTMNGQPLTVNHGFPIRTIVPGYIGARSVKWLSKITLSDRPSPNHFLAHAYKLITEDTPAALDAAPPVYEFLLNSIICSPKAGSMVKDQLTVKGVALPSGRAGCQVKRVELSTDGGETWTSAKFTSPVREYCWVHWMAELPVNAKLASVLVRAVGSDDEVQPRETPWNMKGYQYNGWHKVDVTGA